MLRFMESLRSSPCAKRFVAKHRWSHVGQQPCKRWENNMIKAILSLFTQVLSDVLA